MRLVDKKTGAEIKVGDKVTNFRGEEYVLAAAWPPGTSQGGRGEGKVQLVSPLSAALGMSGHEPLYYASTIGAEFVPEVPGAPPHLEAPWWYLSFCDTGKPKGTQFLGACVVQAWGMVQAAEKAWDEMCNPGGEVKGFEIPADKIGLVPMEWRNRLMSREEMKEIGLE